MKNHFNQIYERLKNQHKQNGWEVNESRLRQQAWMLNDRIVFEATNNNAAAASSAAAGAGAGAGGRANRESPITLTFTSYDEPLYNKVTNLTGTITSHGSHTITEVGFVWSTSPLATKLDNYSVGSIADVFSVDATGLSSSTDYYFRPYVLDENDIPYYGDEQMLTTVSHVDGVDFTIEWWLNSNSWPSHPRPYSLGTFNSGAVNAVSIEGGGTDIYWWVNGSSIFNATINPGTGSWHHYAVTRNNGNLSLYFDGIQTATGSYTQSMVATGKSLNIGTDLEVDGQDSIKGYITNFRWTANIVYTGTSFSVPTSPLTSLPDTKLLLLATGTSSAYIDSSSFGRTVGSFTQSGPNYNSLPNVPVAWSSNSPFGLPPSVGGSLYFNGRNYLSASASTDWNL